MMKSDLMALLVVVGLFVVLGSIDQNAPSQVSDDSYVLNAPPPPTPNPPPASSGPYVIRSETAFAVSFVDLGRGMLAVLGADPTEFCNGNVNFDIVELQEISVPGDVSRLIDLIHGHGVTTSVWPFTDFDCDLFASVGPLATGTVDLIDTDNDLQPNDRNHNAFGFQAHGILTGPNGEKLNFSGHSRCVWDGNDYATFNCDDKINLH